MILNSDHACTRTGEQASCFTPHVTKTLHRHASAFNGDVGTARYFQTADEYAATGGFITTQRAAKMDWFTGDHAGHGSAVVHGVSIHHPRHDFPVGTDIRGRNIFLRSDDNADFTGIAAGQTLQFAFRQRERIDANATFRTAIWQVKRGAFDGHPRRKSHHFVKINIRMITHAAFTWASGEVVLHAVSFEMADGTVIHLHRDIDNQCAFWVTQGIHPVGKFTQVRGHTLDLLQVGIPGRCAAI